MDGKPIFGEKSSEVVFVVGNGFDLAHEMETNYSDFANHYFDLIYKEIHKIFKSPSEEPILMRKEVANYWITGNQSAEQSVSKLTILNIIF